MSKHFCTVYPTQRRREPGVYSGQGPNPSQDTIAHTLNPKNTHYGQLTTHVHFFPGGDNQRTQMKRWSMGVCAELSHRLHALKHICKDLYMTGRAVIGK